MKTRVNAGGTATRVEEKTMRYSTSCSHEWDHAREEFLSIAKEQARNQSLQMARAIGPVRKALRECGINGDPLADVCR